jgi:hypothetical protein
MRSVSSGEDDSRSMLLSLEEAELDSGLGDEQRLGLGRRLDHAAEEPGMRAKSSLRTLSIAGV